MPIKTFTPVSAGKWPLLVKGVCSLGLILTMILWSQVMPLPPPHFEISKMKKIISDTSVMQIWFGCWNFRSSSEDHFSLPLCVDASDGPKVV